MTNREPPGPISLSKDASGAQRADVPPATTEETSIRARGDAAAMSSPSPARSSKAWKVTLGLAVVALLSQVLVSPLSLSWPNGDALEWVRMVDLASWTTAGAAVLIAAAFASRAEAPARRRKLAMLALIPAALACLCGLTVYAAAVAGSMVETFPVTWVLPSGFAARYAAQYGDHPLLRSLVSSAIFLAPPAAAFAAWLISRPARGLGYLGIPAAAILFCVFALVRPFRGYARFLSQTDISHSSPALYAILAALPAVIWTALWLVPVWTTITLSRMSERRAARPRVTSTTSALPDGATAPAMPANGTGHAAGTTASTLAIIAFVASFIVSLAGVVLGHMALSKMNETGDTSNRALAIAALVIGYLGMTLGVIAVIVNLAIFVPFLGR